MELRRFLHILRARWWVVVALALAGAVGAALLAQANNRSIEPRFEAEAGVRVARQEGERDAEYEIRLQLRSSQANSILQGQIGTNPDLSVAVDVPTERVLFRATAGEETAAQDLAQRLRRDYLSAALVTSEAEQIQATLEDLRADIRQLRTEIAELTKPEPVNESVEAKRTLLQTKIASLHEQAAQLEYQLEYPTAFPPLGTLPPDAAADEPLPLRSSEELRSDLAEVRAALDQLQTELDSLDTQVEIDVAQDLLILVKQRQLTDLETQFVDLSVQLLAVDNSDTFVDPFVPVLNRTEARQPIPMAAAVGLFGGGLLAIVALMVVDRLRRPLLAIEDVAHRAPLGMVHRSRPAASPAHPWYPQAMSLRRRQIQVARSALEKAIAGAPTTILVSGVAARREDARELAADLGGAFAAAGRRVLLIDASGQDGRPMPEYDQQGPSLVELLNDGQQPGTEETRTAIKRALADRAPVTAGLVSLVADADEYDPVDLYAGVAYRVFLDVALSEFELVIVAGPDVTEPVSAALAQNAGVVVLAASVRQTTEADLDRAQAQLAQSNDSLFITLLAGRKKQRDLRLPLLMGLAKRVVRKGAKGIFAVADLFSPRLPGPRILIYHQVGAHLGREMEVTTRDFEKQIDWLEDNGEIVDLETAVARYEEPAAHRLFVLTFDDGFEDVYRNAFPLLKERNIPFTLYLTTYPIESGEPLDPRYPDARPLTWEQVQEMIDSELVTVGAHTHTHPDMRYLTAIERELTVSDDLIEERTGVRPRHFTYPWGYWSVNADEHVRERYETATVGTGSRANGKVDPYVLYRHPVQRSDGFFFFRRRMVGGFRLEDRLRRKLRGYDGP
jgi:peptidoglycan/xylan/chitin deacetylase (PgdA/CDA1 family)